MSIEELWHKIEKFNAIRGCQTNNQYKAEFPVKKTGRFETCFLGLRGETLWMFERNDNTDCDGLSDCGSDNCPMRLRNKNSKCTQVMSYFDDIQLSSSHDCIYLDSSSVIKSDSCSSQHIWGCKVRCTNGKKPDL